MIEASTENRIKKLAEEMGYILQIDNPHNKLLRFKRDHIRVDAWYSKMTIGIMLPHQEMEYLYTVSDDDLVEILANPENFV